MGLFLRARFTQRAGIVLKGLGCPGGAEFARKEKLGFLSGSSWICFHSVMELDLLSGIAGFAFIVSYGAGFALRE